MLTDEERQNLEWEKNDCEYKRQESLDLIKSYNDKIYLLELAVKTIKPLQENIADIGRKITAADENANDWVGQKRISHNNMYINEDYEKYVEKIDSVLSNIKESINCYYSCVRREESNAGYLYDKIEEIFCKLNGNYYY